MVLFRLFFSKIEHECRKIFVESSTKKTAKGSMMRSGPSMESICERTSSFAWAGKSRQSEGNSVPGSRTVSSVREVHLLSGGSGR